MQEIKSFFKSDLEELLLLANSLLTIRSFGVVELIKHANQYPDAGSKFVIPYSSSGGLNLAVLHEATYSNLVQADLEHTGALEELVHARLIQRWYEFLSQILETVLEDHFSGKAGYASRSSKVSIKVELKLDHDKESNLVENIKKRAIESFQFSKANEQLEIIEKALSKKIDLELKNLIKKHITVRNIFQHNKGIVRVDDLKRLGLQGITVLDGSAQQSIVKADEKLVITFYELSGASNDFYRAANMLIPDNIVSE